MMVWVLIMYASIHGSGQIVIPGIATQTECERLAEEIVKNITWQREHQCLPYLQADH
jgi:hypothetical protein